MLTSFFRPFRPASGIPAALLCALLLCAVLPARGQSPVELDLRTEAARSGSVERLRSRSQAQREQADALARLRGWNLRPEIRGGSARLMRVDAGVPRYYTTFNAQAAVSSGAAFLRNTPPYNLDGSGLRIGVWDAGSVRATHQEFGGRVTLHDSAGLNGHSTHVAGTLAAAGIVAQALGMAPSASVDSYDWDEDAAEMAAAAATGAGQTGRLQISNHSYGYVCGWNWSNTSGNSGWHWYGPLEPRKDALFGQYDAECASWDALVWNAPYYLPFKSAGNDRDEGPQSGDTVYYLDGDNWLSKTYEPLTDPFPDGHFDGYDTVEVLACAKNIVTVGAVNDAVLGDARSPQQGTMSNFSGWGPADDGRIKPDLVANGVSLTSTYSSTDTSYETLSGTSMASPNAAGSALLLVQEYRRLFPGGDLKASSLKGLLVHTADDLGRPGPDYSFGWGLVNVQAADDLLRARAQTPSLHLLTEGVLSDSEPVASYTVRWEGAVPLRATLCWTDPAGPARDGLDDPGPALVHDLDLRITGPGGSPVRLPWVLDRTRPAENCVPGDNTVDNVEQVVVAPPGTPGLYQVRVIFKGSLADGSQPFSLVLTGESPPSAAAFEVTPAAPAEFAGPQGGPFTPAVQTYTLSNPGGTATDWQASTATPWLQVEPAGGVLGPGQSVDVRIAPGLGAALLAPGDYTASVRFRDTGAGLTCDRGVRLTARPVDHLRIDAIPSPQMRTVPFPVTVSAVDSEGEVVTAFSGQLGLQAVSQGYTERVTIGGSGSAESEPPISNYYEDSRTQLIYLNSEIDGAMRITAIALDVTELPDGYLRDFTIRLQHSSKDEYTFLGNRWEGSGWTNVYEHDISIEDTGWVVFDLDRPFDYNGDDNLLVDFSHDDLEGEWGLHRGACRAYFPERFRGIVYESDGEYGDPLDWKNDNTPSILMNGIPAIRLISTEQVVDLSVSPTPQLVNGTWRGRITIDALNDDVLVRAYGPGSLFAESNAFDVGENTLPQPVRWLNDLGYDQGWRIERTPRFLADADGDGRSDLLGFGDKAVLVARSTGSAFAPPVRWSDDFVTRTGWTVERHPRMAVDVNGDGRADLLGFADRGIMVSLSTGGGFGAPALWSRNLGYVDGWRTDRHPRMTADFNGDGLADAAGFGDKGVVVALSQGDRFAPPALWTVGLGYDEGWRVGSHPRLFADINGDGRADAAGFGDKGVVVALSTGAGFSAPRLWLRAFGRDQGWTIDAHPRYLADMNGDGRADIVGFGATGVLVALSQGNGFAPPGEWITGFGSGDGWDFQTPRFLVEMNDDARTDLLALGRTHAEIALSNGVEFLFPPVPWAAGFGTAQGWDSARHLRFVGDADGDGIPDIIGFKNDGVYVY